MHRRKAPAVAGALTVGLSAASLLVAGSLAAALLAICALPGCARGPRLTPDQQRAVAIAREVERIAGQRTLWPGYQPLAIPLAIYTGQQTLLFRHPAPPEGFAPIARLNPPAHVFQGRFPAVTANTSEDIGGTMTATLMADDAHAERSATQMAAVALHEAFHVDQRARHASWQGNEGSLLLYPAEDAELLRLRRLESEALRRALDTAEPEPARCWAVRALLHRNERFSRMAAEFPTYERATELNEGLASYIQEIAAGRTTVAIPPQEYAPAEVRWRTYTVGPALAFLLDRFRPGWQQELDANDDRNLDQLLALSLGGADLLQSPQAAADCPFDATTQARIDSTARADAGAVLLRRAERFQWFQQLPGWRVVIEAAQGQPLWPQGFDPLNVERVEGGLLHTRFCSLGNDAAKLEAIDDAGADLVSLTEGVGPHPLFQGARRVVIAGLSKPQIAAADGRTTLKAPGLTAEFTHATLREEGDQVLIQLEAAR